MIKYLRRLIIHTFNCKHSESKERRVDQEKDYCLYDDNDERK